MGTIVDCQISPVFEHGAFMSESKYELAFISNQPSLSLVTYTIQFLGPEEVPS